MYYLHYGIVSGSTELIIIIFIYYYYYFIIITIIIIYYYYYYLLLLLLLLFITYIGVQISKILATLNLFCTKKRSVHYGVPGL